MADQIRIVYCPADKPPCRMWIDNTLEAMQKLVGGYIEAVTRGDYAIICNEEGRLKGLKQNRSRPDFVGDIFFVGVNDDKFESLGVAESTVIRGACMKFYDGIYSWPKSQ